MTSNERRILRSMIKDKWATVDDFSRLSISGEAERRPLYERIARDAVAEALTLIDLGRRLGLKNLEVIRDKNR